MRSVKSNLLYWGVIFLWGISITGVFAQEYPVKRDSDEQKLLSSAKKDDLCRIPENVLQAMSTEELIKVYLDCPFTAIMAAYDNLQIGFEKLCKRFKALRELLTRKDAAQKLLRYYRSMNPAGYEKTWSLYKKGKYSIDFVHLEILLAQESILVQLTQSEKNSLLVEAIRKFELKEKHSNIHGLYGLEVTAFLLGRLMCLENRDSTLCRALLQTPGMKRFLNTVQLQNPETLPIIIQTAKEFLQGQ